MSVPPARVFVVAADRRNRPSAERRLLIERLYCQALGISSSAASSSPKRAEPLWSLSLRRSRWRLDGIAKDSEQLEICGSILIFPGVTESGAVPGRTASSRASTLGFAMNWANSSRDEFATARSPGRVALTPRSLWRSGDDQGASPAMRPPSRLPLDRPEQKANNPGVDDRDCLAFYPFVVVRIACRVCSRHGCAIFTA